MQEPPALKSRLELWGKLANDLTQPMDFDAATKFNTFFYTLTRTLANDGARPAWVAGSQYAPAVQ